MQWINILYIRKFDVGHAKWTTIFFSFSIGVELSKEQAIRE